MKKLLCFVLLVSISLSLFTACAPADDPQAGQMETPDPRNVADKPSDTTFESAYTELAVKLFQQTVAASRDKNLMISPLSIQLALAMTANGADGLTRQEMEALLGGDIPLEELNAYLHTYTGSLPSEEKCKLQIANSIWFRDEAGWLTVEESFLQTNADYYGAEVYKRAFDETTVKEINNWVDHNTDGMISKVLDKIDSSAMMYLINAIVFNAEWAEPYHEYAIRSGDFTNQSGDLQSVHMMHGEEREYLHDDQATGFVKPYSGDKYSFAVLLPNEGVDLYDYMETLTPEKLTKTLNDRQTCPVITQLPKFSYEFDLTMNEVLKELGMPTAFDSTGADLTKLGQSTDGNLYIGSVIHKTFIQVDGMGTKAGAVTVVEVNEECAVEPDPDTKEVIVDRPFVYMILDNETNLPIFIGCVTEITE